MKRQINIVSLVLAAAMVFAACQKDEMGLVSLNVEIGNYAGAGNAKMYVDASRYTHWTSGDQVSINGYSAGNTCSVDLSGSKAKITGVPTSAQGYNAIYPAGLATLYFSAISSSATVTLPSTQTYAVDGSGNQIIQAPMAAHCDADATTLTFHNLCSLLKVTVNNDRAEDITLRSITVTSSDGRLSGRGTVNSLNTDSPSLTMQTGSYSFKYVTLDFTSASETVSQGTSKSYYIVVPSFTTSNITIAVEATTSKLLELSLKQNSAVLNANVIVQGPTLNMISAVADFDGFGTESSPFQIKNSYDFGIFKDRVNAGKSYEGKYFKLINSIDLGTWDGVGSSSSYLFKGVFDGNSKTITYTAGSTSSSYRGLFCHLGPATIKNLNVECTINHTGSQYSNSCAGIAAMSYGTTYQYCTVSGTITGAAKRYGGITASMSTSSSYSAVTISHCTSSVNISSTISGEALLGGIVAAIDKSGSLVEYCSASGTITAANGTKVGGISGSLSSGCTIDNCSYTGTVTGSSDANPIVGSKGSGSVTNCTPSDQND